MNFKSAVDGKDFREYNSEEPLKIFDESKRAYAGGTQTPDVIADRKR